MADDPEQSPPEFLTADDVMELHQDQLVRHGGAPGLRDGGSLESAVAAPQWTYQFDPTVDLFDLAAGYAYHIARNHPFVDGNKRAALASALTFLALHGIEVEDPSGTLYQAMLDVASGTLEKAPFASLLRSLPRA